MYKSFYEHVFHEVPQESTRTPFKCWKRYSPTSRKARVLKPPSRHSYKICRQDFFPTSRLTQEKFSPDKLPEKKSNKICRQVFCPTICSIQGKRRISYDELCTRATFTCPKTKNSLFLVHKYLGSEATHLGWSIGSYETWSTRKPCAKAVQEMDYFMQQKQYHKRTTLRTKDPAAKHL